MGSSNVFDEARLDSSFGGTVDEKGMPISRDIIQYEMIKVYGECLLCPVLHYEAPYEVRLAASCDPRQNHYLLSSGCSFCVEETGLQRIPGLLTHDKVRGHPFVRVSIQRKWLFEGNTYENQV
jgi:hypothetical protein